MATMTLQAPVRAQARPAARPVARPAAAPLRLTRRGRLVVTLMVLVALVLVGLVTASASTAGSEAAAPATRSVVVQPGQSLWGFAQETLPGVDVREAVLRLRELNGLRTNVLQPGQVLLVPAS